MRADLLGAGTDFGTFRADVEEEALDHGIAHCAEGVTVVEYLSDVVEGGLAGLDALHEMIDLIQDPFQPVHTCIPAVLSDVFHSYSAIPAGSLPGTVVFIHAQRSRRATCPESWSLSHLTDPVDEV